jgi:hypothetical protein
MLRLTDAMACILLVACEPVNAQRQGRNYVEPGATQIYSARAMMVSASHAQQARSARLAWATRND